MDGLAVTKPVRLTQGKQWLVYSWSRFLRLFLSLFNKFSSIYVALATKLALFFTWNLTIETNGTLCLAACLLMLEFISNFHFYFQLFAELF